MIAVNLWTIMAWAVAGVVVLAAILIMRGVLANDDFGGLDALVPPEIWDQLSPAVKASLRLVGGFEPATRERCKKVMLRMAEGYVDEKRSSVAQEAYKSALLELLGKYTL